MVGGGFPEVRGQDSGTAKRGWERRKESRGAMPGAQIWDECSLPGHWVHWVAWGYGLGVTLATESHILEK